MSGTLQEVQAREKVLIGRLNSGLDKIEAAQTRGDDVARWESLWCSLLEEYEQTFDRLEEMGDETTTLHGAAVR